ncbi:MAG: tol-pal system-associated acyl-CoA thioesterase [Alphaproteobacteria bacterium]|nr:tol-pal system-associated acyl-CoA thioesterase [Alphaproteobacteria bacterium]
MLAMAEQAPQPAGATDGEVHRYPFRVHWEDTDAAGIVYYANYLRFIERGRSDLVRRAGVDQATLLAEEGITFQVRRCRLDYLAPARLDDELEVWTTLRRLGAALIDLEQVVRRGETDLVRAEVRLACVGADIGATRIPAPVRQALEPFLATIEEG